MASRTSNPCSADPGPAAQPNVNNDTTGTIVGLASFPEKAFGATAPSAGTSPEAVQALATVTIAVELDEVNETPAAPAEEQAAYDEGGATSVVDITTPVQHGDTEGSPDRAVSTRATLLADGEAAMMEIASGVEQAYRHLNSAVDLSTRFIGNIADVKEVALRARRNSIREENEEARRACEANTRASEVAESCRFLDSPIHDQGDGVNEDSAGLAHSGGNGDLTDPVEIGDAFSERAMRKRRGNGYYLVGIISGISAAVILTTASALKAAGYAYRDIQWPITLEVMIASIFLTPAYANYIA
ncbi:hypothetical protein EKO27_g4997 [Xylaria grammica]|uniref:Uncharacterized protein n=1 Tax=Xylaria grammica TaxID=363999 RepID=A0A439D6S5_9PEZI|nr:hypothetical protein EKO27_g4997 [Xylaria grammica]